MNGQPPNGAPREPRLPVMNPQERMVWLASHRAPPYFRLVTTAEMSILEVQLRRAAVYESEFRSTIVELDRWGYWKEFPDVRTAASTAAFDARRHERATKAAIERLEKTIPFLDLLISEDDSPTRRIDLLNERAALSETLAFLKAQDAARVEIKPEAKT